MSEGKPPDGTEPLKDLDARLRHAREDWRGSEPDKALSSGLTLGSENSAFKAALRIGVEMVAALATGVGIGLILDSWLDTAPWFLVVFFFLGAGAGILNVYRAAGSIGLEPEYRRSAADDDGNKKD
ncbi:MAG TPA: AtpZ/AtpI family protein [Alphaproteobacteria bacterium]|nr:AtpZ/AtpI family protein [Alphaproteobacteria bacterium]